MKETGNICGAFTPLQWPKEDVGPVADPSGRTFLFSLSIAHGRAVRLKLTDAQRALSCRKEFGRGFGRGCDLRVGFEEAMNAPRGCYTCPNAFELDHAAEAAAGLPAIPFAYDGELLPGHERGIIAVNERTLFAAAEVAVYHVSA